VKLRERIAYAEQDAPRWRDEFTKNAGKATAWPSTERIDCLAGTFRFLRTFLPVIGGAFFLIALFTQPKAQKDESHSGSSASPTPVALSSRSETASKSAAGGEAEAKSAPKRELDDADSAKIKEWVENAIKRGEEWGKESPEPSPSVAELKSTPETPKY
jgi:hypothetical protein